MLTQSKQMSAQPDGNPQAVASTRKVSEQMPLVRK